MSELVIQGLKTVLRSHGLKACLCALLILLVTTVLAGSFSGRQPLTVALDMGFTGLRLILLLVGLFWIQELLGRDIERKTLYFVLAYPISRRQYLLARYLSAALLMLLTLLVIGGLLWTTLQLLGSDYPQQRPPALDGRFALALLGIWLDLLLVMAFATLLASLSTTPMLPLLLGLAFALAARGLGPTFDYLRNNPLADNTQAAWLGPLLDYSFAWLPDLSRLDWRAAILYDQPLPIAETGLSALMAFSYTALLLLLAGTLLERRELT